ncbi:MAG: TFIIB-type zinc ribbon-containing protein [Clostridiales bacterium]|nr:TFIIB-type zinc ribbon-containing protein [Clostridiales bacterium]
MNWNDDVDIFSANSAKCPGCGSNIFFNEKIGRLVCSFCGGIFAPETLEPSGYIEKRDIDEAGEEESNKQEFVCDTCGATLVTDYNTSATFCAFCGSPSLIGRRLTKQFRPDLIIPFKVSKEEAIKNYRAWVATHKGVPKAFTESATLEKITGFYIPFWMIDADCTTLVGGTGQIDNGDNTIANFFIDRTIRFHVTKVPFDGCKKISDILMEAIEPFDYKDLVPYNDLYLPGFYAQRYDKSAIDMLDVIGIRLDAYAENLVKQFSASEYDKITTSSAGSFADNFSQLYALLPVWFLNIKYEDKTYSIAVNGQTGEASGSLPISKAQVNANVVKEVFRWLPLYLCVTAVVAALFALVSIDRGIYLQLFLMMFGMTSLAGLTVFIPFIRKKVRFLKFNQTVTIDKAPGVEEYIDYSGKIDMEKKDLFSHISIKVEGSDQEDRSMFRLKKRTTLLEVILRMFFK